MADIDPNLVQAIAAQVMAALQQNAAPQRADVHAPIGICTGDYSKFTELSGLKSAPPPSGTTAAAIADAAAGVVNTPVAAPANVTALKGVVTVAQLKTIRGPVRLAKGAILSPLAAEYIKDKNITILTDMAAAPVSVNSGPAASAVGGAIFTWIDGQCPSVAKLLDSLRPNVLASRGKNSPDELKNVVKELAALVRTRKVPGGLLFVNNAARAICYANRCASLRAIVATSDRAVADGIDQLGANVLVIEYPQHGFKSMAALVKPFIESTMSNTVAIEKDLNELRNCG